MTAIRDRPSPNFDQRPSDGVIDMLVVHYTGMVSAQAALDRLCDPMSRVSAHYVIAEDGTVWRLVADECRAWHAGVSFWRGATDVNARSIGIELVNPGHELGYCPFAEPLMTAFAALAREILDRYPIPPRNIVGHSDIAPRRKRDPGELFDWRGLGEAGIGVWPQPARCFDLDEAQVAVRLAAFGYETIDLGATLRAFQRHFRPQRIDGRIDTETRELIAGLPVGD